MSQWRATKQPVVPMLEFLQRDSAHGSKSSDWRWQTNCSYQTMGRDLDLLENRTKQFTIDVIRLCIAFENLPGLRQLTWQLADSAGSVGANHRAMRRARSTREFASKLQIVNEEIDESVFWLEVARAVNPDITPRLDPLLAEGIELRAIFAKARATMRQR